MHKTTKTCKLKLKHSEKEKICKFFVAHNGSPAVLGLQDIDRLGMLSINCNSKKNRQVAEESNEDKGKSPRQTKGNRHEQLKSGEQETETQNTQDANYNPTVMGNNNTESIYSLSEVLINQNSIAGTETKDDATIYLQINYNSIDCSAEVVTHHRSFSIEEGEDDMTIIGMQFNYDSVDHFADSLTHNNPFIVKEEAKDMTTQNGIITNNNNEGLIVDAGNQNQTAQKKKRKCNKSKKSKGNW